MAVARVDLDLKLLERTRSLTVETSNRAVFGLALRRLIASKQKGSMLNGISALTDLEYELGSPAGVPPKAP